MELINGEHAKKNQGAFLLAFFLEHSDGTG